nr:DUF4145 domain-containing protein [uncultured Bacteroides sp.]
MNEFIQPTIGVNSFHCPNCGVLTQHTWSSDIKCFYYHNKADGAREHTYYNLNGHLIAKCSHCNNFTMWENNTMIYPLTGNIEMANSDLPEDIQNDYNEAKNIVNISPRGAVALLRLAIQKLCKHLGEKGENINEDIKNLVRKGLPEAMQQALDSVRVIGNNAVHPGTIDFNDKAEIAYALFGFVNIICEILITQPKKIKEYYDTNLPEGIRKNIEKRDKLE